MHRCDVGFLLPILFELKRATKTNAIVSNWVVLDKVSPLLQILLKAIVDGMRRNYSLPI